MDPKSARQLMQTTKTFHLALQCVVDDHVEQNREWRNELEFDRIRMHNGREQIISGDNTNRCIIRDGRGRCRNNVTPIAFMQICEDHHGHEAEDRWYEWHTWLRRDILMASIRICLMQPRGNHD